MRRLSRFIGAGLLVGAGVVLGSGSIPSGGGSEVDASTSPAGARVQISVDGSYHEVGEPGGSGSTGGSGSGGGCTRRWEPTKAFDGESAYFLNFLLGPPPSPEHVPYGVFCGNEFLGAVWLLPSDFTVVAATPTAAEIAAEIAKDLPYPVVTIGANPGGRGLTGLASAFWVDGYGGEPIVDAVDGLGTTVEVEARASSATWDFGDDSNTVESVVGGSRSSPSVSHVYETRSVGRPYTVTATFAFSVRYRVDGGDWVDLPPVERDAQRTYDVVESRGQLVPSEP